MSRTYRSTVASFLHLDLTVSVVRQEVANNRSLVRLELALVHDGTGVWFSASKNGVLHGTGFTYTGGFSGSGRRVLQTRELWVDHTSSGAKSQTFNATFDINITYSGSYRGRMSVSGTYTLPTIPRASTLTSFSIGSHLSPGTANTVNLSISRATTSFTHDIELREGSTVIASWNGQGIPTSLPITATQVNTLLSRMSSTATATLTLRIQTKSGSSNIGGAMTRNATATVNANVIPSISSTSASILGSGRDSQLGQYIQGVSGVRAEFTSSATGGAGIRSRSITLDGVTGGSVVGSVFRRDYTTLNNSGTRTITYSVTDTRGRTTTATRTISVTAYSTPVISTFSATRDATTPTTVNIVRNGSHTDLGGNNTLTISVQRRQGTGAWTNVVADVTSTVATFGSTVISTGNDVVQSYEFRVVLTDQFNRTATASATVTTQRVVLDVHKNEGIGVGKLHEQGVADFDGDIYANGRLLIVPDVAGSSKSDPIVIRSKDNNGHGYIEFWGADGVRKGIVGIPTNATEDFEFRNEIGGNTRVIVNRDAVNLSAPNIQANGSEIVASGSNANGHWVRFYNGTQIVYRSGIPATGTHDRFKQASWTFPIAFSVIPTVVGAPLDSWLDWAYVTSTLTSSGVSTTNGSLRLWRQRSEIWDPATSYNLEGIAIGRWR